MQYTALEHGHVGQLAYQVTIKIVLSTGIILQWCVNVCHGCYSVNLKISAMACSMLCA